MVERPPVELAELPTIRQLAQASVTAFVVATLLLVVCVLPAEFAIDPTGLGRALGLMQLGELKKEQSTVIAEGQSTTRTDELKLTLSPGQSAEINGNNSLDKSSPLKAAASTPSTGNLSPSVNRDLSRAWKA